MNKKALWHLDFGKTLCYNKQTKQGRVSSHVRPDPMHDTETLELKHRGLEFKHRVVSCIHYY